jgi:hypothetical protein
MGNKRGRYENAGRIKSIHTINFRDADEILTTISHINKKVMCLNLLLSHWMIGKWWW